MQTEALELNNRFGEKYAGNYVFTEISWAKRSRIIQKYTKYHPVSGHIEKADYVAIQAETIWASLKKQPPHEPISLKKLLSEREDGVPIELGELFSRIVNRLNNASLNETRFLSEPYEDKSPIQQSQSSACAKSSVGRQNSLQDNQPKQSSNSSSS
jgi:hypothetical protein